MFRFLANSNDQKFHKLLKVRAYAFSFLISSCSKFQVVARCFEVVARCLLHMAWPAGWLDEWLISPICCTTALDPNNFNGFRKLSHLSISYLISISSATVSFFTIEIFCSNSLTHSFCKLEQNWLWYSKDWARLTLTFKRLTTTEIIYQSWHQPRYNWLWQVTQSLP